MQVANHTSNIVCGLAHRFQCYDQSFPPRMNAFPRTKTAQRTFSLPSHACHRVTEPGSTTLVLQTSMGVANNNTPNLGSRNALLSTQCQCKTCSVLGVLAKHKKKETTHKTVAETRIATAACSRQAILLHAMKIYHILTSNDLFAAIFVAR